MIVDTEDLAQMLYDSSLNAKPVSVSKILPLINRGTPGHPALDEPNEYRWFRIEKFPVSSFELTLKDILEEVGSQLTDDKWRHDKIVEILRRGDEEWPALATAAGVLLDGYHRIAAHDTLGINEIPMLVAVKKTNGEVWDEFWNEAFPGKA